MMEDQEKLRRLEATLDYAGRTHDVADIVQGCRDNRFKWFSNGDGNIVAEICTFPKLKTVNFFLIFGELKHCLALEHEVLPWAIENGATLATATGRAGWGRVAAPTGWRPHSINYTKKLIRP